MELDTPDLRLREFRADDAAAVHSYAGCADNVIFMPWGPNTPERTRAFVETAMNWATEDPRIHYEVAVILKSTGGLIGGCGLVRQGEDAGELGWGLHRDYWKRGYGVQMGTALLEFGFTTLGLHRIQACCDSDNYGSYRVMERIGMRREGCFIEARPPSKGSPKPYSDELVYAILRREWKERQWAAESDPPNR